ncbi:conserved hypothetical protein [Frankia canadensis]|uniref:Uncharacterized protein n=1 Tax=Frankia canadensis TaxID=1836972 RepID=A0A2I2L2X4_9ACTN|nr:class I adenylate-forming enzyme family protein [Frankia canadensis]SNQ52255.1 conserved hypothetical protein [Frankia canadensis]SOU59545.1 conserved hypothetical protein [Frankia canadensis]
MDSAAHGGSGGSGGTSGSGGTGRSAAGGAAACGAAACGAADLDARTAAASPRPPDTGPLAETDPHAIFLTSGSTGRPKGVVLSHRTSWLRGFPGAGTRAGLGAASGGPAGTDTVAGVGAVCMFPLFHWAGWQWIISGWLNREPVHLCSADPGELLAAVERHRAAELYCIPAVWRRVLGLPAGAADVRSLRVVSTGTSAAPADLLAELVDRFPGTELSVRYGSTEAGGVAALVGPQVLTRPGSVGRAMPGYRLRLDADGELLVGGPMLTSGYHRLPDQTAEVLDDGWYRSGDLAERDDDGFWSIVGRKKEVIRSGGETIAPREIEPLLATYPGVREAAVVGLPDPLWGEQVCAVLVMCDDLPAPSVRDLALHLEPVLASFKWPRRVVTAGRLPRTSATGQVQRALLANQIASA